MMQNTVQNIPDVIEHNMSHDMLLRILQLHELGLSPQAIQSTLYETCQVKASLVSIGKITNRADCLIGEWLERLRLFLKEDLYE